MTNVFPFIARLAARGDWSSGERARLIRLAEQLDGGADDLDIAFGRTDEGDPWCVVMNREGDVLVHVARVGGRFIVHEALGDVWEEGTDLLTVLRTYMGSAWVDDPADEVVVRLDPEARKGGQGFTALIIATAFYYATSAASDQRGGDDAPAQPSAPDVHEAAAQLIEGLGAGHEGRQAPPALAAPPAPAEADVPHAPAVAHAQEAAPPAPVVAQAPHIEVAAAAPPPPANAGDEPILVAKADLALMMSVCSEKIEGTEGPDVLIGGPGATLILAGGGDDRIDGGGAPHGQLDVVDGGAGNDTITVRAETVAKGGSGADTFLIAKPAEAQANANAQLGVILDLNRAEGDTIKSAEGGNVSVVATAPTADALASVRDLPGLEGLTAAPGEQLTLDLDGDGVADGVLLVIYVGGQVVYGLGPLDPTDAPTGPGLVGVSSTDTTTAEPY